MSQKSLQEFFTPRAENTPKRRRSKSSPSSEEKKRPKKQTLFTSMGTSGKVGELSVDELTTLFSNLIDSKGLATKQDLASTNAEIASLKKENVELRKKVDNLHDRLKVYDRHMRKNNLIFGGIELGDGNPSEVVREFIREVLQIENEIHIGRAFPLGRQGLKKRPLMVEFVKGDDVNHIMSKVACLKGTSFFVHRDYSQENRIIRSKLTSIRKEILKLKQDTVTSFRREALVVKDVPFVWDLEEGLRTAKGEDGVRVMTEILSLDLSDIVARLRLESNVRDRNSQQQAD
ncbi:hypothetical protein GE061_020344 [Apolygus lucorum]|uniref:Uncharacterized protein n=1 Tax=Apolygus lucorum TaxID=248454 RepID=A0A6A4JWP7_APOLU|nr:hypothetical protein GE061_020344 [Apolygus lucorum]